MENISNSNNNFINSSLMSELSKSVRCEQPRLTNWSPPDSYYKQKAEKRERIRTKYNINVQGEDIPPPITNFDDMLLPRPLYHIFKRFDMKTPSPVQIQGIPAVLSGRNVVVASPHGTGKSMISLVPIVYFCLEKELTIALKSDEGPYVIVLCHSSNLAHISHELVNRFFLEVWKDIHLDIYKPLSCSLLINEDAVIGYMEEKTTGIHVLVATPEKLIDALNQGKVSLNKCFMLCLNEADDLLDKGYKNDVETVLSFFKGPKQTLVLSASLTEKIQNFSDTTLIRPIIISDNSRVSNSSIQHFVESPLKEEKFPRLLEVLKNISGPTVIFVTELNFQIEDLRSEDISVAIICDSNIKKNQSVVDDLFKKKNETKLLITTDIAIKYIRLSNITHVISYNAPVDPNIFFQRTSLTGHFGQKNCRSTTFIDPSLLPQEFKDLFLDEQQTSIQIQPEHVFQIFNVWNMLC